MYVVQLVFDLFYELDIIPIVDLLPPPEEIVLGKGGMIASAEEDIRKLVAEHKAEIELSKALPVALVYQV